MSAIQRSASTSDVNHIQQRTNKPVEIESLTQKVKSLALRICLLGIRKAIFSYRHRHRHEARTKWRSPTQHGPVKTLACLLHQHNLFIHLWSCSPAIHTYRSSPRLHFFFLHHQMYRIYSLRSKIICDVRKYWSPHEEAISSLHFAWKYNTRCSSSGRGLLYAAISIYIYRNWQRFEPFFIHCPRCAAWVDTVRVALVTRRCTERLRRLRKKSKIILRQASWSWTVRTFILQRRKDSKRNLFHVWPPARLFHLKNLLGFSTQQFFFLTVSNQLPTSSIMTTITPLIQLSNRTSNLILDIKNFHTHNWRRMTSTTHIQTKVHSTWIRGEKHSKLCPKSTISYFGLKSRIVSFLVWSSIYIFKSNFNSDADLFLWVFQHRDSFRRRHQRNPTMTSFERDLLWQDQVTKRLKFDSYMVPRSSGLSELLKWCGGCIFLGFVQQLRIRGEADRCSWMSWGGLEWDSDWNSNEKVIMDFFIILFENLESFFFRFLEKMSGLILTISRMKCVTSFEKWVSLLLRGNSGIVWSSQTTRL